MFIIGVVGVVFTVFNYFKDPQISEEKKSALLASQFQWTKESNESRFSDLQSNFQQLLLQSNNHIHTVDVKVEALAAVITSMGNEITRLSTIIDERIPKKV